MYKLLKILATPLVNFFLRPEIMGKSNLISDGKSIIICNHNSNLDPVVLGCIVPRKIYFIAKSELFKVPVLGFVIKKAGVIPVKRGSADLTAIRNSINILTEGNTFGIFPEGTRSKDGLLHKLQPGVAIIALKSGAPVVPIIIHQPYRIFRKTKIAIGRPIDLSNYKHQRINSETIGEVTSQLESALKDLAN